MKRIFGPILLCGWLVANPAIARSQAGDQAQIQSALDDSAAGWQSGNFARFITVYEHGPATVYVSHDQITTGFDAIRASYAQRFASAHGDMGNLSVKILSFRELGPDHAFVLGQFNVMRGQAVVATGVTSLVFHRAQDGWHIVADHTD